MFILLSDNKNPLHVRGNLSRFLLYPGSPDDFYHIVLFRTIFIVIKS